MFTKFASSSADKSVNLAASEGTLSYAHQRSKLEPRSVNCVFLGYSTHKAYKCYSPQNRRIYHTMDVTFFEREPYYTPASIQGDNGQQQQQTLPTQMELPLWDIITPETETGSEDASKVIGKNTNTASQSESEWWYCSSKSESEWW